MPVRSSVLSIVVPAYNESSGIEMFHREILLPELQKVEGQLRNIARVRELTVAQPYEIIYVNDGSSDSTLEKLQGLAEQDSRVKVVNFSRNFGKEIATTAGVAHADGAAIVMMDADGQHPPSYLSLFLNHWQDGAQVVVGVRKNHKTSAVKTAGSKAFYRILGFLSEGETVPNSTDFRLLDYSVAQEFLAMNERQRITRGLIDWMGFKRAYVDFEAPSRLSGEATYDMRKLIVLALNSFITMSIKPLFAFGYLGALITVFAFIAGVTIFCEQILLGDPLDWDFTGSALLGIFVSFLVGIVLISQGMMAVYMSHIYVQAQGRPLYIVDTQNSRNLKED